MFVNDIENKDQLHKIVNVLLKDYGIKHNKQRKPRHEQNKASKRIFGVQLEQLDFTDGILANGSVVRIPRFVADACNRILENVTVEGIFRKAGSAARQKDIRMSLESGVPLGRTHHVIDIANVLKYFIRELPEPLIPNALQHTMLRCFLLGEQRNNSILLACLLLPTLHANTLAFFMQFLQTVSLHVDSNKMSTENLAIIFTPSIMPCCNINSNRFNNHVKLVQLLIEHSNSIGMVPKIVLQKLNSQDNACKKLTPHKPPAAFDLLKSSKQKRRTGKKSAFNKSNK